MHKDYVKRVASGSKTYERDLELLSLSLGLFGKMKSSKPFRRQAGPGFPFMDKNGHHPVFSPLNRYVAVNPH